ncbi:MAG: hypothetical protein GXP33_08480 [Spirochaetes bacterium]|nr:hypothetical protein [Spirochaetota bacterium]
MKGPFNTTFEVKEDSPARAVLGVGSLGVDYCIEKIRKTEKYFKKIYGE